MPTADETEQYRQENAALKNEIARLQADFDAIQSVVARLKTELTERENLLEAFTLDDLLRKFDVELLDDKTGEVLYTTKKVKHED